MGKAKKDADAPKRPRTAYILFSMEYRKTLNSLIGFNDGTKLVSALLGSCKAAMPSSTALSLLRCRCHHAFHVVVYMLCLPIYTTSRSYSAPVSNGPQRLCLPHGALVKSANAANDVALVHAAECRILLMHATASMLACCRRAVFVPANEQRACIGRQQKHGTRQVKKRRPLM